MAWEPSIYKAIFNVQWVSQVNENVINTTHKEGTKCQLKYFIMYSSFFRDAKVKDFFLGF